MTWTIEQIERTFLSYMVAHGHVVIEGHSVRSPTDDVLFTTAGMHPLIPYLKGELVHPAGRRLTDVQRCVRTTDVDEVGDNTHLTVFEMLGNWSLGDYFKETSIPQSFGLLTGEFGIDPHSLYVTVFAGDDEVPADAESPAIWEQVFADAGVDPTGRINPLGEDDNWWSNGPVGLCGPDTEIFVHVGDGVAPPFADIPEFVEIWNNVFMTYNRSADGVLTGLAQRNVDTGMGLERLALFLNDHTSVWETDELALLLDEVGDVLGVKPAALDADGTRSLRIVTDHLRASLAIAAAGIQPSASRQGYVLRKLIRRAVRHGELLQGTDQGLAQALITATDRVSDVMGRRWPDVGPGAGGDAARETIDKEARKFSKTLRKGVDQLQHFADLAAVFDGDLAFKLADTMGYPVELSAEEAGRIGMALAPDWEARYDALREEQRARSRG
ncbi:MAG: alanine--tRNA ligase-related protein [Ilumatobacteraceae bacterium]